MMIDKFLKIIIYFVAGALVLLGIFYFSSKQQETDLDSQSWLQKQVDDLKEDNLSVVGQANQAMIFPVRGIESIDHVWGNLNAPVQLIVYSDFDCPFCYDFNNTIQQAKQVFGQQLVIAWRHYPLASHQKAIFTALAAECAAEQNAFWPMQEKLFENYKTNSNEITEVIKDADELGLDKNEFKTCLIEERYYNKIIKQKQEAEKFGVLGTPTTFLNKMILPGAYQFNDFTDQNGKKVLGLKSLIEQEL